MLPRPRAALTARLLLAGFGLALVPVLLSVGRAETPAGPPAPEVRPARFLRTPAVSPDGKRICFSYLGDLWVVPSEGGRATRLTVHSAADRDPIWSPDGRWIVFTSDRDGQNDLYLVAGAGGRPRRLTYHLAQDVAVDWSPDGRRILFYSAREGDLRGSALYETEVDSGKVRRLLTDESPLSHAVYAPDGRSLFYTRGFRTWEWWRQGYAGSGNGDLYRATPGQGLPTRLTEDLHNDVYPQLSPDGKTLYFVSDREGAGNLYRMPAEGGRASRVTHFTSGALRSASLSRDGSLFAFERDFGIWVMPAQGGEPKQLEVLAQSDDKENLFRRETFTANPSEMEISPDGKRLALVLRGDIYLVTAKEGGDGRNLTERPSMDADVVWSPDGKELAFISDRDGNDELYVMTAADGVVRRLTRSPQGEHNPVWSPDGKRIAFRRGPLYYGLGLYTIPAAGGTETQVVSQPMIQSFSWSPDGRWLAYAQRSPAYAADLWVVRSRGGKSTNVTRWRASYGTPRWTSDGKFLIFSSDRDGDNSLYALSLEREKLKDEEMEYLEPPKPPAPKPEKPADPPRAEEKGKPSADSAAKPAETSAAKKPPVVKIDFEDIHRRAKRLTSTGDVGDYEISPDGKLVLFSLHNLGNTDLWSIQPDGEGLKRITQSNEGPSSLRFPSDGSKVYYVSRGTVKRVAPSGGSPESVPFTARMEIDRQAEYAEMFHQAWDRIREGFYDPTMHGVDWEAVRQRYEPLIAHIATRQDFSDLVNLMLGELNSSHLGISVAGGPGGPSAAHLGVVWDVGAEGPGARVASVVPRSPADREESRLRPGDRVLEVDGKKVEGLESLFPLLYDKAGRWVTLQVSDQPDGRAPRRVRLKTINSGEFRTLQYEQWVDERRALVDRLSGGRLAYLHIRGMDQASLRQFRREYTSDAQEKEGLVLDVRFNGGGNTHDDILSVLDRRPYMYWQPRDTERVPLPFNVWNRPTVLLTNEASLSDAELFPKGFQELKLGPIVGMPTAGWLIFTSSVGLIDGSSIRMPYIGIFTLAGENMERWGGVQPDLRVEHTQEDIAAHRDRQLEAAVQEALKRLNQRSSRRP